MPFSSVNSPQNGRRFIDHGRQWFWGLCDVVTRLGSYVLDVQVPIPRLGAKHDCDGEIGATGWSQDGSQVVQDRGNQEDCTGRKAQALLPTGIKRRLRRVEERSAVIPAPAFACRYHGSWDCERRASSGS